ncbi:MAG: hypothetical protein EOO61_03230 [Hymenobacter sp.]|nr:MAG: hypothetical protein EOO61_03230 [Hymenobacter sp.]
MLSPNKVKHFASSTELKSKTDQLDVRLLCRLGLERALPAWSCPAPVARPGPRAASAGAASRATQDSSPTPTSIAINWIAGP